MARTPASTSSSSNRAGPPPTTPMPNPSGRPSSRASDGADGADSANESDEDHSSDTDGDAARSFPSSASGGLPTVRIKFVASLKKYIGDRSPVGLSEYTCSAPNPEAAAQFAWEKYNSNVRGLAVKDSEGNWSIDKTKPNRDWDNDIDDYIHVYLGNRKHVFARSATRGTGTSESLVRLGRMKNLYVIPWRIALHYPPNRNVHADQVEVVGQKVRSSSS